MEQRRQIVGRFISRGLRVSTAVYVAGMTKSGYYYRCNGKPKGNRPSTQTASILGHMVSNEVIVSEILDIITPEYHDYGYQVVTQQLRRRGYIINPKKVYRLMKEHELLHPKITRGPKYGKQYVRHRLPLIESPFATVEADIKYVYIHEQNRNAFLITFLCTFSRFAAVWELDYSMQSGKIADLVRQFLQHPVVLQYSNRQGMKIKIRTDNGPQFIAKKLADELARHDIEHEFINPATPQENGHIESFHSTITRLVCSRNIFTDLDQTRETFSQFYKAYNYTRVMKSLLYNAPFEFLELWNNGLIGIEKNKRKKEIFVFRQKPEAQGLHGSRAEDLYWASKNMKQNNTFTNLVQNSPV